MQTLFGFVMQSRGRKIAWLAQRPSVLEAKGNLLENKEVQNIEGDVLPLFFCRKSENVFWIIRRSENSWLWKALIKTSCHQTTELHYKITSLHACKEGGLIKVLNIPIALNLCANTNEMWMCTCILFVDSPDVTVEPAQVCTSPCNRLKFP